MPEWPDGGHGPCASQKQVDYSGGDHDNHHESVAEQRVVAISLVLTNVTSIGIPIRNWIKSATEVLVVAFVLALMARERIYPVGCGRVAAGAVLPSCRAHLSNTPVGFGCR